MLQTLNRNITVALVNIDSNTYTAVLIGRDESRTASNERVENSVTDEAEQLDAPSGELDGKRRRMSASALLALASKCPHAVRPIHEFLPVDIILPTATRLLPALFVQDENDLNLGYIAIIAGCSLVEPDCESLGPRD